MSASTLARTLAFACLSAGALSCALVLSFDEYQTSGRYAVRGTVGGLEGADAQVTLNANGVTATSGNGTVAILGALGAGGDFSIRVDSPGHDCDVKPSEGQNVVADVDVRVSCRSKDATLDSLAVAPPAYLRRPFDRASSTFPISTPLVGILLDVPVRVTASATSPTATIRAGGVELAAGTPTDVLLPLRGLDVTVTPHAGRDFARVHTLTPAWPTYVKPDDPAGTQIFGSALALDGDTLAIAAVSPSYFVKVDVYRRSGPTWRFETRLFVSNQTCVGGGASASVALRGDTLVVGWTGDSSASTGVGADPTCTGQTGAGGSSGAAYVFRRVGPTWTQEAYLKASNATQYASFGSAVALGDDALVVGAEAAALRGAAYVFRRTGATWVEEAIVNAPTPAGEFSLFGKSVALAGDTLVVGSPFERSGAAGVNGDPNAFPLILGSGAAYVFRRSGAAWAKEAYLKASTPFEDAHFGSAVALSGETLVIGAPFETIGAIAYAGAVYAFRRVAGTWVEETRLTAGPRAAKQMYFGKSVALQGDLLAAGATGDSSGATGIDPSESNPDGAPASGAVFMFRRVVGAAWSERAFVKAWNTRSGAQFGSAVALSGSDLAVGAQGESGSAIGVHGPDDLDAGVAAEAAPGAAYLY